MMQLRCPWCGMRDENEFLCGGTTHISRPDLAASDTAWAEYLFFRENPRGVHLERWRHAYGCGAWFNLARDTVTHEILATYGISDPPPAAALDGAS
jgi:sarcosine oxidase, subunit delta